MVVFLKTIQVLSIILAIISIPLIFIGVGIFTLIPMAAVAFFTEKAIKAHKNGVPMSTAAHSGYIVACILGGLASGFGVYALGALGNIDTTGKPDAGSVTPAFIVAAVITFGLIFIGNRVHSSEPSSSPNKIDAENLPSNDNVVDSNPVESVKSDHE